MAKPILVVKLSSRRQIQPELFKNIRDGLKEEVGGEYFVLVFAADIEGGLEVEVLNADNIPPITLEEMQERVTTIVTNKNQPWQIIPF